MVVRICSVLLICKKIEHVSKTVLKPRFVSTESSSEVS